MLSLAITMHYLIRSLQVHLSTDSPPGGADNPTRGGAGGLDIRLLDATVQELFTAGLAPANIKVYRTGTNRYTSFCVLYNVTQPFPVSEDVLTHFVAYLYMEGLKPGTINSYLVSIRHTQSVGPRQSPH